MKRMAAAANRTGLIIVGLLSLAAGLVVLAIGLETDVPFAPGLHVGTGLAAVLELLALPFSAVFALAFALVLAVIGVRWLALQIPRAGSAPTLRMQADARTGLTTVTAEVIAAAIAADAETTDEIAEARAILRGTAASPELLLHIDVDERADIDAVVAEIIDRVPRNASRALGSPLGAVAVEVGIARTRRRRQRSVRLD